MNDAFVQALIASFVVGLATGLGALGVWMLRRPLAARAEDILLGTAAGVMLAASFFSLLAPGLEAARSTVTSPLLATAQVLTGLALGVLLLALLHGILPHEHFVTGPESGAAARHSRIRLFVAAITLHNFPEGLAVGIGFDSGSGQGLSLALGIALQNIPEGLVVAAALRSAGLSRAAAFGWSTTTGLLEGLGGIVGSLLAHSGLLFLPIAMGTAAGAMLFVISGEIIPETHARGHHRAATHALMGGIAFMLILDALAD